MIKVALRGLAGRKLRAVLTGVAIVLGVAMISGTYILTDTVQRAFNELLVDSYAGTDAVVTGKGLEVSIDGEKPPPPPVDASVLEVVRDVDEVALATGSVLDEENTKILTPEGEAVNSEGFPTLGLRHRHRSVAHPVQPPEPLRGPLARSREPGRYRRRNGGRAGIRGRRHDRDLNAAAEATVRARRRGEVRRGRQPRCDQLRGLHDPRRAAAPRTEKGSTTRSPRQRSRASPRTTWSPPLHQPSRRRRTSSARAPRPRSRRTR